MKSGVEFAIVMPAYNEAGCIKKVAEAWLEICRQFGGNLLIINDGSKDDTGAILDGLLSNNPELKVIHQANAGHGAAVLRGYQEIIGRNTPFVFQTDSDDQFKPSDFESLWQERDTSPFIIGVRKNRQDPLHRMIISRIVRMLNLMIFGVSITDANVPFRLIRIGLLKALLQIIPNTVFAPNIFISVLAAKSGCPVLQVPIYHEERKSGVISIVRWNLVKICFRCLKELIQFRFKTLGETQKLRATLKENNWIQA